jgi:hypothetical protein
MMNALLAVVPWPYLWLVLLIALSASGAFGFVKGLQVEGERRDVIDAKREVRGAIIVQKINLKTYELEAIAAPRREKRVELARSIAIEVNTHAALPDPVACHLEPERVHTINRAWGVGADSPGADATVPQDSAPQFGLAPGAGGVGDGAGG